MNNYELMKIFNLARIFKNVEIWIENREYIIWVKNIKYENMRVIINLEMSAVESDSNYAI